MTALKKRKKSIITGEPDSPFEKIKKYDNDGIEYWSARELGKILEYREYKNFVPVIERAITACNETGISPDDHFVEMNEMVNIGSKARRELLSQVKAGPVGRTKVNRNRRRNKIPTTSMFFAIEDGRILDGSLPTPKRKLVEAWIEIHRDDLFADWQLAVSGETVFKIKGLE